MKVSAACFASSFVSLSIPAVGEGTGNSPVTKVVKVLESMLEQSEADGEEDAKLHAKFTCYCETHQRDKTQEVEDLTSDIEMLEGKISGLQSSNRALSIESVKLEGDIADAERALATATAVRKKENDAFVELQDDLVAALDQMVSAIKTLAEVGADQTASEGAADFQKFMAKKGSLLQTNTKAAAALKAVSVLLEPKQRAVFTEFLQAPFTGSYTSQSAEVMGIIKNMKDTFEENLASARKTEETQETQFKKFAKIKREEIKKLTEQLDLVNAKMADNDSELGSRRKALKNAQEQKEIKEQFLADLVPLCEERTKEYEKRKALRASEDAALAEAIAVLNSDAAFGTFQQVDATSGKEQSPEGFLQTQAVRPDATRDHVRQLLQSVAGRQHSLRLAQIAASLEADNAFTQVLGEIDKMLDLIVEEGKADKEKLDWCRSEREANDKSLDEKNEQIDELVSTITELTNTIEEPDTGLKDLIASDEASLVDNANNQKQATKQREEESAAYETDIQNLVTAEDLLSKAIKTLVAYYDKLADEHGETEKDEVILSGEDTAVAATGEKFSTGQSASGEKVIGMLKMIHQDTKDEEAAAHESENESQKEYEDLMQELTDSQADLQKNLGNLKETLAQKEKERLQAKNDLKETQADKAAIEDYLKSIKAGCDFMEDNFDLREKSRAAETDALNNAIKLLKGTPAYQTAMSEAHVESLGECKDRCADAGEDHVKCKACLAKVEVPGYCAGHPDTMGC